MLNEDGLLPCPFCGVEPDVKQITTDSEMFDTFHSVYVVCRVCGGQIPPHNNEEIVKSAWNRRQDISNYFEGDRKRLERSVSEAIEVIDTQRYKIDKLKEVAVEAISKPTKQEANEYIDAELLKLGEL